MEVGSNEDSTTEGLGALVRQPRYSVTRLQDTDLYSTGCVFPGDGGDRGA